MGLVSGLPRVAAVGAFKPGGGGSAGRTLALSLFWFGPDGN
jgi:hypothetical protein